MYKKILEKYGLSWDDLDKPGFSGELETLNKWADDLKSKVVTTSDIKEHIESMRYSVELALVKEPEYIRVFIFKIPNEKNIFLKARLNNYLILEAFLSGPGKARKAVEQAVKNIVVNKK